MDPRTHRVLVAVDQEMLGEAISAALTAAGLTIMRPDLAAAIRSLPSRKMLIHPSVRPDVVVASPELASELAMLHFNVIAVGEQAGAPLVAYTERGGIERRIASIDALVELVNVLAGIGPAAASY
jgi:hypothetical protein